MTLLDYFKSKEFVDTLKKVKEQYLSTTSDRTRLCDLFALFCMLVFYFLRFATLLGIFVWCSYCTLG